MGDDAAEDTCDDPSAGGRNTRTHLCQTGRIRDRNPDTVSVRKRLGTAEGGGSPLALGAQSIQTFGSSIIRTYAVRALRSATVVVDVNLAEGVSLDGVAAYAAMVAFAEITPSDNPMPNSVLGMFEPGQNMAAPTDWDISFLKALYSIPADRAGWKQKRMLVGKILKDSEAAGQIADDEDLTEGLADPSR